MFVCLGNPVYLSVAGSQDSHLMSGYGGSDVTSLPWVGYLKAMTSMSPALSLTLALSFALLLTWQGTKGGL